MLWFRHDVILNTKIQAQPVSETIRIESWLLTKLTKTGFLTKSFTNNEPVTEKEVLTETDAKST